MGTCVPMLESLRCDYTCQGLLSRRIQVLERHSATPGTGYHTNAAAAALAAAAADAATAVSQKESSLMRSGLHQHGMPELLWCFVFPSFY